MVLRGPSLEEPVKVQEMLESGLLAKPDSIAMVSSTTRWTWRQLDRLSTRLAVNLLRLGLQRGDRVASLMPNRSVLLIHYLACIKAGLVAVPLNYRYMAPEVDHALEVCRASLLIAHAERRADLERSRLLPELPLGVVSFEAPSEATRPRLETLMETNTGSERLDAPDPAAPAFVFFTSGSTGKPKGVTHTRETLGYMLASTAAAFELSSEDIVLPGSSVSHLGGFMFSFAALSVGARAVVARSIAAHEMIPLLRETRPTVLCMLPSALLRLVRERGARKEDFASLRLCRGGADKVPAELEREFTELTGFPIDEGYGMTEVGLAALNPPSGQIKIGSVGIPVAGFEMDIRDEQGHTLPAGADGRLWMRSRSATTGYWQRPDATRELFVDSWLDSGDIMRADEDGYLWFRGRKKQIIVHDGSNICPQEVEDALLEHPALAAAGAVGVDDPVHGENVIAFVSLRPGVERPDLHELIEFARQRVGYKAPEEIVVLEEMPLNPTGKTDRVSLKRIAQTLH